MGGIQSAGLKAREARLGSDQGRHRRVRHRPAGAAVVVNPNADDRSWAAMQQKNPGAVVACIRQLDHMTGTGYNSHRGHGVRR